jgi:hypothetical protein
VGQLLEVDPYAKHLSSRESIALAKMLDLNKRYSSEGRPNAAYGVAQATWILWAATLDFSDTIPSDWGSL